jgi:hypothetical protein
VTHYDNFLLFVYNHLLYVLVWLHFVMDFVCQSSNMATKKSTSNGWLSYHVAVYTLPFLFFGIPFALINGLSHLVIDWCTSRVNSRLWKAQKVHWFFVGVGFDQAMHMTILLLTAKYLLMAF